MAKEVLDNAYVTIDTVDLSANIQSITLPLSCAEIDKTCMADNSVARLAGLKDASLEITFAQDWATSKVAQTLDDVYFTDSCATAIAVRKDSGAIAATNPEYQFNAVLTGWSPIDGSVGELATAPVSFVCNGDVTRDITP